MKKAIVLALAFLSLAIGVVMFNNAGAVQGKALQTGNKEVYIEIRTSGNHEDGLIGPLVEEIDPQYLIEGNPLPQPLRAKIKKAIAQ